MLPAEKRAKSYMISQGSGEPLLLVHVKYERGLALIMLAIFMYYSAILPNSYAQLKKNMSVIFAVCRFKKKKKITIKMPLS